MARRNLGIQAMDCHSRIICERCGAEAVLIGLQAVEKWHNAQNTRVRRYAGLYATIDCVRCGRTQQCVAAAPKKARLTG